MVADRVREEIIRIIILRQLDFQLGAAQARVVPVVHQLAFGSKVLTTGSAHFKDGDRSFLHVAAHRHADARLEMGIQFIVFQHVKRDGTMCQAERAVLGIDGGGI